MSEPAPMPQSRKWPYYLAGAVAVALVAGGIASRSWNDNRLGAVATAAAIPTVTVLRPQPSQGQSDLTLPGALQAFNTAPIYARTSGYVRQWFVNLGDRVVPGQVLAVLDAPEVEQQLAAARADFRTARANERLASTTATRWDAMLAKDAVSRQEADERRGELAARTAVAEAAQANVRRLEAMMGFTRLRAPFAGIVTARNAEIGALVTVGNAAAQPLFTVADIRRIRIFVRVPQAYAAEVQSGLQVGLTLPEYPGRQFTATLVNTAGAVDPSSGTLLVELQATNDDRALRPGSYAQAKFPIHSAGGSVTLPPSALMIGQNGTRVAILRDGRARLRQVTLGTDFGRTIEIRSGLTAGDRVIDSPPESLADGDEVRVATAGADRAR